MTAPLEGARGPAATGPDAQGTTDDTHSASLASSAQMKDWRTVQAECLLAGFKADVIEADDGSPMIVVSRWALTRSFHSPDEARQWLQRVAGGRA